MPASKKGLTHAQKAPHLAVYAEVSRFVREHNHVDVLQRLLCSGRRCISEHLGILWCLTCPEGIVGRSEVVLMWQGPVRAVACAILPRGGRPGGCRADGSCAAQRP